MINVLFLFVLFLFHSSPSCLAMDDSPPPQATPQRDSSPPPPPGYELISCPQLSSDASSSNTSVQESSSHQLSGVTSFLSNIALRTADRWHGYDAVVLARLQDGTFPLLYPGVNGTNIRNRAVETLVNKGDVTTLLAFASLYRQRGLKASDFERTAAHPLLNQLLKVKQQEAADEEQARKKKREDMLREFDTETQALTNERAGEVLTISTAAEIFLPYQHDDCKG